MRTDKVVAGVLGEDMTITPSDLCNVRFKRAVVGGYRSSDVDAFLERTADVLEDLIVQVRVLREKREEQNASLEDYHEREDALRSALVSSQRLCEEIVGGAKREAEALIEQARAKKAQIELEAAALPATLSQEVRALQELRNRLRADMLALFDAHKGLLDRLVPEGSRAAEAGSEEVSEC